MPRMQPVDVGFVDRAAHVVRTDVDIDASIDEVWEALADNTRWVDWFDCSRCTASPGIWTAAGDTRTIKLGPLTVDEIAVEIEAPNCWAMTLVRSNLFVWTRGLEMVELFDTSRDGETRTEIRWTGAFEFHPFARPMTKMILGRAVDTWGQGFENLADHLRSRR